MSRQLVSLVNTVTCETDAMEKEEKLDGGQFLWLGCRSKLLGYQRARDRFSLGTGSKQRRVRRRRRAVSATYLPAGAHLRSLSVLAPSIHSRRSPEQGGLSFLSEESQVPSATFCRSGKQSTVERAASAVREGALQRTAPCPPAAEGSSQASFKTSQHAESNPTYVFDNQRSLLAALWLRSKQNVPSRVGTSETLRDGRQHTAPQGSCATDSSGPMAANHWRERRNSGSIAGAARLGGPRRIAGQRETSTQGTSYRRRSR